MAWRGTRGEEGKGKEVKAMHARCSYKIRVQESPPWHHGLDLAHLGSRDLFLHDSYLMGEKLEVGDMRSLTCLMIDWTLSVRQYDEK